MLDLVGRRCIGPLCHARRAQQMIALRSHGREEEELANLLSVSRFALRPCAAAAVAHRAEIVMRNMLWGLCGRCLRHGSIEEEKGKEYQADQAMA